MTCEWWDTDYSHICVRERALQAIYIISYPRHKYLYNYNFDEAIWLSLYLKNARMSSQNNWIVYFLIRFIECIQIEYHSENIKNLASINISTWIKWTTFIEFERETRCIQKYFKIFKGLIWSSGSLKPNNMYCWKIADVFVLQTKNFQN